MVYDYVNDQVVLFGGNSSPSGLNLTPLGDTYVLDLKEMNWTRLNTPTSPPARLYHAMVMDSVRNQILVYSGGDEGAFLGPFFKDVWRLKLDTMEWAKVWGGATEGPLPRINAVMIEDVKNERILMFGGHDDGMMGNSNELWEFDGAGNWTMVKKGDAYTGAGCSDFCSCPEIS